ncbi:NAD(P)H-hydrate dehydratase [Candidatus Bipolaricaulota bacterium]|nr:NAD(P)H-hydrate dehydratase [Candidatus Bipolaricaulota bacterium]
MKYATTSEKVKELDRRAIEDWGMASPVLMENAGRNAVEVLEEEFSSLPNRIMVIAGKGNNGGDGLVVARRLLDRGHRVEAFVLGDRNELSPETRRNADILERMTEKVRYCRPDYDGLLREIESNPPLIVDSIFGIGIEGKLRGEYPNLISRINNSEGRKVAVDLPSGLPANSGNPPGKAVRADLTVTMGLYKLGTLLSGSEKYVGEQRLVPVGYPDKLVEELSGLWRVLDDELGSSLLPERTTSGHKGSFGRLLVVGGSRGMSGAPLLAARGGLRSGAGLVFLAGPESLKDVFGASLQEALTIPVPDRQGAMSPESMEDLLEALQGKDALAVGPGIGRRKGTARAIRSFIDRVSQPLVLDADGIVAFSEETGRLEGLKRAVLTPHPGELAHLVNSEPEKVDRNRFELVPELAQEWGVTLLLKGVPTAIASPNGDLALASCPNSGLAKGGSGDVLTGFIGSFLAQGLSPFSAARLGAWLHCRAGELGSKKWSEDSLQPGDMTDLAGSVISDWRKRGSGS